MTSTAQLEANRCNALRSTGPRTATGTARTAANGVRHGLTGRSTVSLTSGPFAEDDQEVQTFIAQVVADLDPRTTAERSEAVRIAGLHVRLRRLAGMEAAAISSSTRPSVTETLESLSDPHDDLDSRSPQERLAGRALDASFLDKLPRYEAHLSRELDRSLTRYWAMQQMRRSL